MPFPPLRGSDSPHDLLRYKISFVLRVRKGLGGGEGGEDMINVGRRADTMNTCTVFCAVDWNRLEK